VFDKFPKYKMKILLGDFNAKVGKEDIFKPTIGNESLHEISNDNGFRLVNFATSKTSESKGAICNGKNPNAACLFLLFLHHQAKFKGNLNN
jgi:hypothetical protein